MNVYKIKLSSINQYNVKIECMLKIVYTKYNDTKRAEAHTTKVSK